MNKYKGDYHTKHFKCWNHLASMMIAYIHQEDRLRDIDITLNVPAAKLYHIGIKQCPKSMLADANELRDYLIYEEFAKTLMHRARCEYTQSELAVEMDNAVYKVLWEIESFSNGLNKISGSNLAVKTQVWIVIFVYLALAILKKRYHLDLAMSQLLHFLKVNQCKGSLMNHRSIVCKLRNPLCKICNHEI